MQKKHCYFLLLGIVVLKNWKSWKWERVTKRVCLVVYIVLVLVLVILNSDGSLVGFPDTTNTTQCADKSDYWLYTIAKNNDKICRQNTNIFNLATVSQPTKNCTPRYDTSHF